MPDQVTDTSGITDGDGHFLHDHSGIMSNPAAKNALAKYDNVEAAMLGGFNAMQQVGKPHINIPADDADDTVKAKFKTDIAKHSGAVEKADDFKVERPEGSDETNYNFAAEKVYLEMAVKEGMSQSQMAAGLKMHNEIVSAIFAADTAKDKADIDASVLKMTADLGGADKFKEGMELKARLCATFFDEDTAKLFDSRRIVKGDDGQDKQLNGTVFGNHAGLNLGLVKIAEVMVKEGRTLKASAQTGKEAAGMLRYKGMEEREATGNS